jgi:hypothetical protein
MGGLMGHFSDASQLSPQMAAVPAKDRSVIERSFGALERNGQSGALGANRLK